MQEIIKIIQYFSELSSKIKLSNQLNLMDTNILSENQIMTILNILFDWKLYNRNTRSKNAVALDLVDDENNIAIQVTSDTSTQKMKQTIKKAKSTPFAEYQLYMFYLCDTIPTQTKNTIKKQNIKALCFSDLIQEFNANPQKAQEFIKQYIDLTVHEKFKEYLQYINKWSYDEKWGGYYYNSDPNYKLKVTPYDWEEYHGSWFCEIKAISKYYPTRVMQKQHISLFYDNTVIYTSSLINFYEEELIIALPISLFYNSNYDLFFDGYLQHDKNNLDLSSFLTYFFKYLHREKSITYNEFVYKYKVLTYDKPSYEFIPLIFFKDYNDFKNFEFLIDKHINNFNYETEKKKYDSLDRNIINERMHKMCCFHFWIYELYYDNLYNQS